MKRKILACACVAVLLMFARCGDNSYNPGPPSKYVIYTSGVVQDATPYQDSAGYLILYHEYSYSYCLGDSLVTNSSQGDTIRIPYEIDGNTLKLVVDSSPDSFFIDPTAVVILYELFTGTGTGTGLIGTWTFTSFGYSIVQGTLTVQEQAELDTGIAEMNADIGAGEMSPVQFTGSEVIETTVSTYAADFIENWNWGGASSDSALYNIAVSTINTVTVRLVGLTTSDTVVISWDANGNKTFSSSDTLDTVHTYYGKPIRCPNLYEPAWYTEFLNGNHKPGMPKSVVLPAEPAHSPRLPRWIVKMTWE